MTAELGLPNMKRWVYSGLGSCRYCWRDEADVRLYKRRNPERLEMFEPPRCRDCARAADAKEKADER